MSVIAAYVAMAATVFFGRALVGVPGRMWKRLPARGITTAARTPEKRSA
jgi:hypothetical protein